MRKPPVLLAIGTVLIGLGALFMIVSGRNHFIANVGKPAVSPSGRYLLKVLPVGKDTLSFAIYAMTDRYTESSAPLYAAPDTFNDEHVLFFLWDKGDRVWVYSGDIGTFFWQLDKGGEWTRHVYVESDIVAPDFLKQVRPDQHGR